MSGNKTFRLIKLAQKLFLDISEMQAVSDKGYRYTVCQDLRKKSEDVIHLIRDANSLDAGSEKRIELQFKVDKLLENIKDLLPPVGKLLKIGVKHEAQVELSIENLQRPLHNWMESDQKISVSYYEKQVRMQSWEVYRSIKIVNAVFEYSKNHRSEKIGIAMDESRSRQRIAEEEYESLVICYDKAVKRLRETQEHFHKDDSVLMEVIEEINRQKGSILPSGVLSRNHSPSRETVNEKKDLTKNMNAKILEKSGDTFSDVTKKILL